MTIDQTFVSYLEQYWYSTMLPADVEVVPYKINMYQEGGGFAWHSDTPEPGLIGTILVGLIETRSDKCFKIKHDGNQMSWNATGSMYSYSGMSGCLPNVLCFYADCPHHVQVKKGVRATIAFKVFAKREEEDEEETGDTGEETAESGPEEEPVGLTLAKSIAWTQMTNLLSCTVWKRSAFGLILSHSYSMHASTLKGNDVQLLNIVLSMSEFQKGLLNVSLVPVCVVTRFEGGWGECEDPESISITVYTMTDADLDHGTSCIEKMQADNAEENLYGRVNTLKLNHVPFLTASSAGGKQIMQRYEQFCEHTGNQCQPESLESVYMHRAIIVSLKEDATTEEGEQEEETGDGDDEQ